MSTSPHAVSLLQLRCFVGVVEAGSFAEAGRRLAMTTSGVSRAISRLESDHAVRLLHRSTHALSLTAAGELVFKEACDVLSGAEAFGETLSQAADDGRVGRVRISAPPGFERACLIPQLPPLLDAHPGIQVDVQGSYRPVDLAEQGVDIALRAGRVAGLPGHVVQELLASPWCAYAAPPYLAARGVPLSPDDLRRHVIIGFRNAGTGRAGDWMFHDPNADGEAGLRRYEARADITFDDGPAAYDLACFGHGIVWAPQYLALNDVRCGRMVEVLAAWRSASMTVSIVRRERRLTPLRIRTVIDHLLQNAGSWRDDSLPK